MLRWMLIIIAAFALYRCYGDKIQNIRRVLPFDGLNDSGVRGVNNSNGNPQNGGIQYAGAGPAANVDLYGYVPDNLNNISTQTATTTANPTATPRAAYQGFNMETGAIPLQGRSFGT